jgi:hypothetical protein
METNSKLRFLLMVVFGMLIGLLIVLGVLWSAKNPDLMYFVAANVVTLIILAFTLYGDKKSSEKLDEKINKITNAVNRIERKLGTLNENNDLD